jgi:hypothetical protein
MGKFLLVILLVFAVIMLSAAFLPTSAQAATQTDQACWGQATAVFAQTGEMGEHSSQQATPRLGLRNLARALADAGIIPDDSMQALGTFVANELGLSIQACY